MTRTTLRHGLILFTAGIGASLGFNQSASAETPSAPAVLKISPGYGGELEQNGGAGTEQMVSTVMNEGGKQYVVSIYMSSNVDQNKDGYWQCKCTSVLMDPTVGPVIVADQIQLTNNGGERPCNHPGIASDGSNLGVWGYGTNETNGNTRTYVQGINNMCKLTTERLRISEDNNQNENAMTISYNANGYFTAGYLSTANNDKDASYAVVLKQSVDAGTQKLEKMALTKVVAPSNIGRPSIVDAGPGKAFFCASKGNERPPEQGVECALLDAMTGNVLSKQLIAASDPENKVYMNSPTVAKISDNTFAVQVIESNGNGRKSNEKGANYTHLYAYKVTGDTFEKAGFIHNIGAYPTHSSICAGSYGAADANYVGVIGLSPTGTGQPSMQFVSFNAGFAADKNADKWTVGYYGDSGKVANLYGANPKTQGRDYPICYGNIKNPGFGVTNGYMADVESFFLVPHAGNNKVEMKNAGYLSFVPGKVTKQLEPQPPQEQPKKGITPPPGVEPPDLPETIVGEGAGSLDDGPIPVTGPGAAAACSVPAPGSSSPANLAFLALGVGALFAARRRR
jgi:MYXO-CTERM domain-containing protein